MEGISISIKRGRPTKFTKETSKRVITYIKSCVESDEFPTIEQLSSVLGVGTRVLYVWEKDHEEFLQAMDSLRDAQRHLLISGGLNNKYNARFAAFLLKANHGMNDSKPVVNATQNNTFNVSPEILAEAIELTRARDNKFMTDQS